MVQNSNQPFSVCRKTGSTSILITKWYNGWNTEYHGNLASGKYDHAAAHQVLCASSTMNYNRIHGQKNHFFFVDLGITIETGMCLRDKTPTEKQKYPPEATNAKIKSYTLKRALAGQ